MKYSISAVTNEDESYSQKHISLDDLCSFLCNVLNGNQPTIRPETIEIESIHSRS